MTKQSEGMTKLLHYKGFYGIVHPPDSITSYWGEVLGIADIIGFGGATISEAEQDFHCAVDDYIAVCARLGVQAKSDRRSP